MKLEERIDQKSLENKKLENLRFAFLHVEITHDATEDDDDQTDEIYMLLMTEPSNYDIEILQNVSIPQRNKRP